jgi:hypothetical protein
VWPPRCMPDDRHHRNGLDAIEAHDKAWDGTVDKADCMHFAG